MYQSLTEAFSKDMRAFRQYLKAYFPWIVIDFRRFQIFGEKEDPALMLQFRTDWDRYSIFDMDFFRMLCQGYLQASLPHDAWEQVLILGLMREGLPAGSREIRSEVLFPKVEPLWKALTPEHHESLKEARLFDLAQGFHNQRLPKDLLSLLGRS